MSEWDELADWWVGELGHDPAYREEVLPLLQRITPAAPGERWLDLGCGEGQGMRALRPTGARLVGCDASRALLRLARRAGPVVEARLPDLGWVRAGILDGAVAVLVLEHIEQVGELFRQAARAVRPGGFLVAVANHPVFTAPGSGPVLDPADGEVLWRFGPYLEEGESREPAGGRSVTFFHRPMGLLLEQAARAGWSLERMAEQGVGERAAGRDGVLALQRSIPRLLGLRWRRS